ncbi:MAG: hypothetical protein AAGB04_02180 [Pseudomonadota bacterium]
MLSGEHRFTVTTKTEAHVIRITVSELWFVNTAWPHHVANTGSVARIALLLNVFSWPEHLDMTARTQPMTTSAGAA